MYNLLVSPEPAAEAKTRFDHYGSKLFGVIPIEGVVLSLTLLVNALLTVYIFWWVGEFHNLVTCQFGYADYFAQNCLTGLVSLGLLVSWLFELLLERYWDAPSSRGYIQQRGAHVVLHSQMASWCLLCGAIFLATSLWQFNMDDSRPKTAYLYIGIGNLAIAAYFIGNRVSQVVRR